MRFRSHGRGICYIFRRIGLLEGIRPEKYGALGNFEHDDSDALQAADDAAFAAGRIPVILTSPNYKVTRTIVRRAPWFGNGFGITGACIWTTVNDGSPTLYASLQWERAIGFRIFGAADGIKGKEAYTDGYVLENIPHISIRDITCMNLTTAYKFINSYTGDISVWAQYCKTGLWANAFNALRAFVNMEACNDGMILTGGGGSIISGVIEGNIRGLTMDNCTSMSINAYFEANIEGHIIAGKNLRCSGIELGGNYSSDSPVILDMVTAPIIKSNCLLNISNKTRNIKNFAAGDYNNEDYPGYSVSFFSDVPQYVRTENVFPNPYFRGTLESWKQVINENASPLLEFEAPYGGGGLRVVCNITDQNFNAVHIKLPDGVTTTIKGKRVMFGAWVFIPDISYYQGSSPGLPDVVILDDFNGSTTMGISWKPGKWNWICREYTPDINTNDIRMSFYANRGGRVSSGGEYCIFGGAVICLCPCNYNDLMNGKWF